MSQDIAPGTALPDVNPHELLKLIPHRYPMLLVDRIIEIKAFESACGIRCVSFNEPFFPGHFPTDPIMPGVMIIEALAQTAAALVVVSRGRSGEGDGVYFLSVEEAKFRRPVRPGDTMRLEVTFERQKMGIWRFRGTAKVDGKPVTSTIFSAKVFDGGG